MAQLVPLKERKIQVRDLIHRQAPAIAAALPRGMGVDRFARIVQTVVLGNEDLLTAEPQSLVAAILQVAAWGLEVDPVLGMAYLIPYKGKVKLIPGYRGLVELARRSGDVLGVSANCVYEGEQFEVHLGLHKDIIHEPLYGADRGPLWAVYAVAEMRVGQPKFEVMTIEDVNLVRKRSAAGSSGPWVTDYEAMALKTVVRRLCNRQLPRSPELARAVALDEQADRDEEQTFDIGLPEEREEPKPSLDTLAARLGAVESGATRTRRKSETPDDVAADEIFTPDTAS